MGDDLKVATLRLLAYCQTNDWAGYDPYDALNSRLFKVLPFLDSRIPRLVLIQTLKRSPVNIRRLLLIPKTQNPKAIGLFLSASLKLSSMGMGNQEDLVGMIERLTTLRSQGIPYWCWGYSFPWQTRTDLVPAGDPNLVCTVFAANALLDAYEQSSDPRYLNIAASAAEYILDELYWTEGNSVAGFSYPLSSNRTPVHNANFLAAALLCRIFRYSGEEKFLGPALRVARYSAARQRGDGSWGYGEAASQQWVDNFHTGYNLCALQTICRYAETTEFVGHIHRGFEFYRAHFFLEDGAVRYFHNHTYPLDIHCVAQSIITLLTLRDQDPGNLSLACSVFHWAMEHLWDDRGFFYYRALRFLTIRTSYMRWSQAWMLLAMSMLLCESESSKKEQVMQQSVTDGSSQQRTTALID